MNHDSRDRASLGYLGTTSTGVPVSLNRAWMSADIRITTGFVEPHFFAGFSGGPKMVAPGLAGLETVLVLHDAQRIGHPNATWGITEGNPIHDDVREIARMAGVDFSVDVTLNREQKITAVFAGDLFLEHRAACESAKRDAMRPVDAPFDVVLTTNSGFPLDQNLYQAVKGMSAAAKVVKPGGTIVCAAECCDGLPSHGSYGEVLASQPSPEKLLAMINAPGYSTPDQWQVQIQAQLQMKATVHGEDRRADARRGSRRPLPAGGRCRRRGGRRDAQAPAPARRCASSRTVRRRFPTSADVLSELGIRNSSSASVTAISHSSVEAGFGRPTSSRRRVARCASGAICTRPDRVRGCRSQSPDRRA